MEQFKTMVIGERGGRPIPLSEVADVRDGVEETRSLALVNGVPAIGIDVQKQSGANTVNVVDTGEERDRQAADGTTLRHDYRCGD